MSKTNTRLIYIYFLSLRNLQPSVIQLVSGITLWPPASLFSMIPCIAGSDHGFQGESPLRILLNVFKLKYSWSVGRFWCCFVMRYCALVVRVRSWCLCRADVTRRRKTQSFFYYLANSQHCLINENAEVGKTLQQGCRMYSGIMTASFKGDRKVVSSSPRS